MPSFTERDFEKAIEAELTSSGGYGKRHPNTFDEARALFPDDIVGFLTDSQPVKWESLEKLLGSKTAETVLDGLSKELEFKGTLHILRHGFKCYGKTLRMAYFRPNTTMNPEAADNYAKNRLTITRQVSFTSAMKKADGKNRRCIIDVTLAVNGIPVVTVELKNQLTGQHAMDAVRQYKDDRDGRDLLFAFKKRTLVHFAVDPDEVWMTTRLRGKETHFLPFNRGNNHGAGNPPVEGNWKSHYLWDEVLQADRLLEILQRFMHLEVKEKQVNIGKRARTERKEKMIFPRYHQLDAVRKLVEHAKANGAGRNYLIQHSAGSGKSNSIAWLSHRLASLHDNHDAKVFHSVIVVTDRRVLDQQLQETIYQFEHKAGVVEKIDEDTQQLARALSDGTPIVITTIQKFPFISQALSTLAKKGTGVEINTAGKCFAVIVDEAHSSQSGETATALRGMLNKEGIEAAIAAQLSDEEDYDLSDGAKAEVLRDALQL
ncbi:MAG: type I restriction endonuclease subunit R, partial [Rhodothermaceae bacterium]|nr:type I restriction endonuclease subunit R [Rhodothermaceae bacterium]